MNRLSIAALAALVLAPSAGADKIPASTRPVRHELVFEVAAPAAFEGMRLVLYPTSTEGSFLEVVPGAPVAIEGVGSTRLHAVRGDVPGGAEERKAFFESLPRSEAIQIVRTVVEGDPTVRIVTTFDLRLVDGPKIVSDARVQRLGEEGEPVERGGSAFVPGLLGSAVTAVVLLAVSTVRRRRGLAAVALLLAVAAPAGADILPDGHKGVRHEIRFEGMDREAFAGVRFVLYPTDVSGHWLEVAAGKPVAFYHLAGPRLYAVKDAIPEDEKKRETFFAALPRSEPIGLRNTLPESDPRARIATTYRIAAIDGLAVALEKREEAWDADGERVESGKGSAALPGFLGTSAIAMLLLAASVVRRRRGLAAVALLLAVAVPAGADILPDGHKGVRHEIRFEGMDREAFAGVRFVLYPTDVSGHWLEVAAGKPVAFYHLAGPRLYAVKDAIPEDEKKRETFFAALPRSEPIGLRNTLPESDPRARIATTYRIAAIDGLAVALEKREEAWDADGERVESGKGSAALPGFLGTSAIAMLLLAASVVRRRRGLAAVALLLAVAAPAGADAVAGGCSSRGRPIDREEPVRPEVRFTGLDDAAFGGYRFVLYPTDAAGGWTEVVAGEPVSFDRGLETRLVAVKGEIPEADRARRALFDGSARSRPISPAEDSRAYRVVRVGEDVVELEDATTGSRAGYFGTASLLGLALLATRRRNRP